MRGVSASRAVSLAILSLALASCSPSSSGDSVPQGPEKTYPYLLSSQPAKDATGVPVDTEIWAHFSKNLDAASISTDTFTLTANSIVVPGTASLTFGTVAEFVPDEPLEYDTLYTATCTKEIRGATGENLRVNFSWSFTTGPPPPPVWSWEPAVPVETSLDDIPDEGSEPDIALDDDENACVVWRQSDGATYRIWARRSAAGGDWESQIAIDQGDSDSQSPVVGIDGGGQILAAWSTESGIWGRRAASTGDWSPAFLITVPAASPVVLRQLLVDDVGNAFLYYSGGGDFDSVTVIRFDWESASWESPFDLEVANQELRPVAMHRPSGFVVMTWRNVAEILSRRYLPGSGWTPVETLAPWDPDLRPTQGKLVMHTDGTCVVTWMRQRIPGNQPLVVTDREFWISRCTVTESWSESVIGPPTFESYGHSAWPGITSDGSLMITMIVENGRSYASRETGPGTWTDWVAIDPNSFGRTTTWGCPIGAVGGRFAFIGEEVIGNERSNVWIKQFDPETGWGASSVLRGAGGYIANMFKIVTDSQGRTAAVWLEAQGPGFTGGNDIWCARYR